MSLNTIHNLYIFDNNIITEVTRNKENTANYINLIIKNELNICIPTTTLAEAIEGLSPESETFIAKRFENLALIIEQLGSKKVSYGYAPEVIIAKEIRRSGNNKKLPCETSDKHEARIAFYRDSKTLFEKLYEVKTKIETQRSHKASFFEKDKQTRKDNRISALDHQMLLKFLEENRDGISASKEQVDLLQPILASKIPLASRNLVKKILLSKNKYRYTRSLFNLIAYRFWFRCVDPNKVQDIDCRTLFQEITKVSKGDWFDHNTVCYASYGGIFVTNDQNLIAFTKFLKSKNIITFEAINWDTFKTQLTE